MAETKDDLPLEMPISQARLAALIEEGFMAGAKKGIETAATQFAAQIVELQQEVEGLRKDAERWCHASTSRNFGIAFWGEHGQGILYDALAAKHIDASLSSGRSGSGEVSNG